MSKLKIANTNIPTQQKSLTATYTAIDWKKIPVNSIGDPLGNFQNVESKNKIKRKP